MRTTNTMMTSCLKEDKIKTLQSVCFPFVAWETCKWLINSWLFRIEWKISLNEKEAETFSFRSSGLKMARPEWANIKKWKLKPGSSAESLQYQKNSCVHSRVKYVVSLLCLLVPEDMSVIAASKFPNDNSDFTHTHKGSHWKKPLSV